MNARCGRPGALWPDGNSPGSAQRWCTPITPEGCLPGEAYRINRPVDLTVVACAYGVSHRRDTACRGAAESAPDHLWIAGLSLTLR